MSASIFPLVVANTILPLLGMWALVAPQRCSRLEWLGKVALVAAYLGCVIVASVWLVPSVYAPYWYPVLFVIALALSWLTARKCPWRPASGGARIRAAVYFGLAAVCLAVGALAWHGRTTPEASGLDLEFPLRDGRFYIARAGRGAPGIDVVAVDRLGQRANGLHPDDPEAYTIFGMPVYAPCDGSVVRVVNDQPDQRPPATDASNPLGNHVVLACGPAEVVLAHLRQGSVELAEGAAVKRGERVGAVGSSGASTEPHLHVRARRPGGGDVLPITFDGRAPRRGLVRPER